MTAAEHDTCGTCGQPTGDCACYDASGLDEFHPDTTRNPDPHLSGGGWEIPGPNEYEE